MLLALRSAPVRKSPSAAGWTSRVLAVLRIAIEAPARFAQNRRLLHAMAQMSDYELRDIGLSRQDVSDATALPLGGDPSVLFAARAADRRRWSARR